MVTIGFWLIEWCRKVQKVLFDCMYGRGYWVWGRKDAFPGADGSTIQENGTATTVSIYDMSGNTLTEGSTGVSFVNITTAGVLSGNTALMYSAKHPLTFIFTPNAVPHDWYTNNASYQNNNLWNSTIKSVCDPCPQGWRVPTDGSWGDFSVSSMPASGSGANVANGRIYYAIAWYPAAGRRLSGSGALYYAGSSGTFRSSTSSGVYAKHMSFDMSDVGSSNTNSRAYSFSVRCVQE